MEGSRLLKQVDKCLEDMLDIEKYNAYLRFIGRFYRYNFYNQILIYNQFLSAVMVAGQSKWEKLGRVVKRYEIPINILVPKMVNRYIIKSDNRVLKANEMNKDELINALRAGLIEKKSVSTGFIGIHVFDITQTTGKDVDIRKVCINDDNIVRVVNAVNSITGKREGLSSIKELKDLIHETTHILIGNYKSGNNEFSVLDRNIITGSIKYVVLYYLGILEESDSINDLGQWLISMKSNMDKFRTIIECVSNIGGNIISYIDEEFGVDRSISGENDEDAIRDTMADELLSTLEANVVRLKI